LPFQNFAGGQVFSFDAKDSLMPPGIGVTGQPHFRPQ
jgi:hypothetical protein